MYARKMEIANDFTHMFEIARHVVVGQIPVAGPQSMVALEVPFFVAHHLISIVLSEAEAMPIPQLPVIRYSKRDC